MRFLLLTLISLNLFLFSFSEAATKTKNTGKKSYSKQMKTKNLKRNRFSQKQRGVNKSFISNGSNGGNAELLAGIFLGNLLFGKSSETKNNEINNYIENENFVPLNTSMQEMMIIANRKGWKIGAIRGELRWHGGLRARFYGEELLISEAPEKLYPGIEARIINIEFYWDSCGKDNWDRCEEDSSVIIYFIWRDREEEKPKEKKEKKMEETNNENTGEYDFH